MKRTISSSIQFAVLVSRLVLLFAPVTVSTAGLVSGQYRFNVRYSSVCLNGTYPFSIGRQSDRCFLTLKTDASGALTGMIDLVTLKSQTTGKLGVQNKQPTIDLQTTGHDESGVPLKVHAELQGKQFTGTATTAYGSLACSLDVSAVGPLNISFDIDIAVNSRGQIAGSGVAHGCGVDVPVQVDGKSGLDQCMLHVTGVGLPGFTWQGSGKPTYSGFKADWTGKGFGFSATGTGAIVEPKATAPALLGNISTRLRAQTGENVLIGGFIITGTQSKKVMIRAIGPSLPVAGNLADPILELHDSTGAIIASNDNWKDSSNAQAIIETTIPPSSEKESAIVMSLTPGAYTAVVRGVNNTTGVALVEVYDLAAATSSRLANISTRGFVQTGDNVMIGGFIVLGTAPQKVIVRAIGPSLPVANKLADPMLELHNPNGDVLAANDNWTSDQAADIVATKVAPADFHESAIVANVLPGNFTAIVRGVHGTTGVALVEAYGLNP